MYNEILKKNKHLTDFDAKILGIIYNSPLPYIDTLHKQLCVAKIKVEDLTTSYVLDIHIDVSVDPIPTSKTVPVSIDICPHFELFLSDTKTSKYCKKNHTIHLIETPDIFFSPQSDLLYTGINLHFEAGVIREIELVNWSGFSIECCKNCLDIDKWEKIFRYNDEQWFNVVTDGEQLK